MGTPALKTEDIARAIDTALQTHLPAALQAVENRWLPVEPYVLYAPKEYTFGFAEDVLDLFIDQFPRVAVVGAPRRGDTAQGSDLVNYAIHVALVEWQVLGSDSREATIRAWRYGEAICDVLTRKGPFAGFDVLNIIPAVDEGQATSLRGEQDANTPLPNMMAGGSVQLALRGKYVR